MPRAGKYVRAPPIPPNSDEEEPFRNENIAGLFVRAPNDHQPYVEDEGADHHDASSSTRPNRQEELEARILELENVIKEMSRAHHNSQEGPANSPSITPTLPSTEPPTEPYTEPSSASSSGSLIRWDNIKPFPKNVPATRMWEAWTRFLDDFETAVSLSNLRDPKRRVELLLLSMGDELKSIVRAAKLRPIGDDDNCYVQFINNINQHLKAMTDPAAEHEDFSRMVQEEGESAVKFHARLTEKVLLCDYSPVDQDRFVRTQLLRGLRNQELIKTARTYNHDSNTIVQAATRAEAFQAEMSMSGGERHALVVSNTRFRGTEVQYKRGSSSLPASRYPAKRFKSDRPAAYRPNFSLSRRSRCPRCFRSSHGGDECPALKRNCNSCGQRGHFAAACRMDRVNTVKDERPGTPTNEDRKEQVKE